MSNTRLIGEALEAIQSGQVVKVKGVGLLLLNSRPKRHRRTKEEMKAEKKELAHK